MGLLHRDQRLLFINSPHWHGTVKRKRNVIKESFIKESVPHREEKKTYPSSPPVTMCSSFISWIQSIEPLQTDKRKWLKYKFCLIVCLCILIKQHWNSLVSVKHELRFFRNLPDSDGSVSSSCGHTSLSAQTVQPCNLVLMAKPDRGANEPCVWTVHLPISSINV